MDLYAENILDHYRHPREKKELAEPTVTHEEVNHSCGDALEIRLIVKDGIVTDAGWTGTGCAISQASMSMLAEELIGKTATELESLRKENVYDLLGVPVGPRRFKCALLSLHALKNALRIARGEAPQGWLDTVELASD